MVAINTNIPALNASAKLSGNAVEQTTAMQRLSTGLRVNSAKDDASSLAISTKLNSNIRGIAIAIRNSRDAISMVQIAENSLGSMNNILLRMKELAIQASNATLTAENRKNIQIEFSQLASEINNISKTTNFNGIKLLDGTNPVHLFKIDEQQNTAIKAVLFKTDTNTLGLGSRSALTAVGFKGASGSLNKMLSGSDLKINGIQIEPSQDIDDNASSIDKSSSAIAKAAAINKSTELTGVVATIGETVSSGVPQIDIKSQHHGSITINGLSTGEIKTVERAGENRIIAIKAINSISGATGVIAVDTGSDNEGIQLIAKDGRNISVTVSGTLMGADIGLTVAAKPTSTTSIGQSTDGSSSHSGSIIINDVEIPVITSGNARVDRQNIVSLINSFSNHTNIKAIDLGDAGIFDTTRSGFGIKLTAQYGGNINVQLTGMLEEKDLGLANGVTVSQTVVVSGTYHLQSIDGLPIDIKSREVINNTPNPDYRSTITQSIRAPVLAANPIPAVPLNADTLLINNETVPAASAGDDNSDITSLSSVKESSAKAIAAAINKITSKTDVTATSQNTVIGSNFIPYQKLTGDLFVNGKTINLDSLTSSTANIGPISNSSAFAGSLFINGYAYSLEPLATSTSKSNDFVNLINAQTATTNIMATADTAGNFTIANISGGDVYFACMESNYNPDGHIHPSMTTSDMITALSLPADTLGYSNPTQFANGYDPRHKITATINAAIGDTNFARYDHYNFGTGISFYSDGSNIELGLKTSANPALILSYMGINSANIFVAANATASDATTNYGSVTLDSDRAIKIATGASASASSDLSLLGIRTGIYFGDFLFGNSNMPSEMPNSGILTEIYKANETFVSSTPRLPIISGQLPSRVKLGDFIINGINIPPSDELDDRKSASVQSDGTTALSSIRYLSGIAVAAAINKISDVTGVTAKLYPTQVISHEQFNGSIPISLVKLYLNGVKIDFNTVSDNTHTRQDIADCINLHSHETGVFAQDNGIALTLTAADGRNIEMAAVATEQQNPSLIPNALGLPWAAISINPNSNINLKTTTFSSITLVSDKAIKITSNSPNGLSLINELGFKEGVFGGSNNGKKIFDCDVTNINDDVLTSIDVAIGQISNMRSTLGALQNKLIFAIDNLTSRQNNTVQSNSRLVDSDYSNETTQLARFQIITQSSLSLLAQANQQPQLVLQLLKNNI